MNEENLNPFGIIKTLMNNKGFIRICRSPEGGEGGGEGGEGGEGGGEGGGAGAATLVPDWRESLEPSIKDHPSLANFKTPADVAKSYVNVQQLIGKKGVPLPSKEADPMQEGGNMEYNTVYDTLGRPSDPKAYEIPDVKLPEGLAAPTEQQITGFKELSHKIGLLPHQVKALYQWNQEQATGMYTGHQEGVVKGLQESEAAMRQEYGKQFDGNLNNARNLIAKFGGQEVAAALESSGLGNNPHLIRMMVKIAGQFTEDGNIQLGEAQPAILTPDEAKIEVDKIMADKVGAYWNKPDAKGIKPFSDGEHKAMVKKVNDLLEMASPSKT